jgi:predicted secreted protein
MSSGTDDAGRFGPFTREEYKAMGERMERQSLARALARVAYENPEALRLATQLLGVPACPTCDFVMRPGHVCVSKAAS